MSSAPDWRRRWVPTLALVLFALSFVLPVGTAVTASIAIPLGWSHLSGPFVFAACALFASALAWLLPRMSSGQVLFFSALALLAALAPLWLLALDHGDDEPLVWGPGFWCYSAALLLLAGLSVRRGSHAASHPGSNQGSNGSLEIAPERRPASALGRYGAPLLFGIWVLVFWQLLTRAFDVPQVLLPAPSNIGHALVAGFRVLISDVVQTVLHSALIGLAVGSALGFALGLLIDRSPFLERGLLPIAALTSAVPLVGVAPIMVMWFGFDWHSKAAVVVVMTFFPMLVNTLAGLAETGAMERDLMRSYGAGAWRTLVALRIPAALPFVFNALKINASLAMIGAIVAEFFGSPVSGLGFRISTEAARLHMGLVWAAIAVAAVAGSLLYGLLAWAERRITFWHASNRRPA